MYKLKIVADLHHFPESLSDGGRAYHLRSTTDQVCLCESGAIIDAAFEEIANSDCDAVLIAGDISNDGEKLAHDEMLVKLNRLAEKKKVFVVYSTHDWCCNGDARRFVGDKAYHDVETVTAPYLREFYRNFGENQAYDTYENEIGAVSYAVKLDGKVRLIGLNDDKNGKGKAGYCDEHFEWILRQVKDAKANGEAVVIMEHHLVMPHISRLINGGQMIGDADERAEALAHAGADFVIVGHSHMQRTTQHKAENGNILTQINVSSLCGHPSAITTLTVEDDEFRIDVDRIEKFTYNGTEYTNEYITDHTLELLKGLLNSAATNKAEFIDRFNAIDEKLNYDGKYYKLISMVARWLLKMTVGKAGRLINFFTFGKGINRKAIKQIKNDNLVEHIMKIYLCVFDGSLNKCTSTDDPVYIIVKDIASLPSRVCKALKIKALQKEKIQKIFRQIEEIAEELTNPSLPDNQHAIIKR